MSQELLIIFYDVEHGSSAYLRTPDGKNMVIDLGVGSYKRSDDTFSPLAHLWNRYGIRKLDCVFVTHPHRDHLDDINNFGAFSPSILYTPRHLTDDDVRTGNQGKEGPIVEKFLEIRRSYSFPVSPSSDVTVPANVGGMEIAAFNPYLSSRSNLNNHSLVIVITYAGSKIIIPGDNESPAWNELLKRPDFLAAINGVDILVAAHHGREAGYSEAVKKVEKKTGPTTRYSV